MNFCHIVCLSTDDLMTETTNITQFEPIEIHYLLLCAGIKVHDTVASIQIARSG